MNEPNQSKIPFTIVTTITREGGVAEAKSFVSHGAEAREAAVTFVAGVRFMPALLRFNPTLALDLADKHITTRLGADWTPEQFDGATFESADGTRRINVEIIAEGVEDGAEEISTEEILG
jgi:hypothetical protein